MDALHASVTAIVPAHNEADIIGDTVRAILSIPAVSEVIVVDDASSDGTAEIAEKAGADTVIVSKTNVGKGGALNIAWPAASGEILLLLDADLGHSASEGSKLLEPVLRDEADMTVGILGGSRPASGEKLAAKSGGFGLVVKTARFGIKAMTGKTFKAPISGQRAVRKEMIKEIGGFSAKFGVEVGLTIDALRLGYRVTEVPVEIVHRASGRDLKGFIHRGRQMWNVICTLLRKAIKR